MLRARSPAGLRRRRWLEPSPPVASSGGQSVARAPARSGSPSAGGSPVLPEAPNGPPPGGPRRARDRTGRRTAPTVPTSAPDPIGRSVAIGRTGARAMTGTSDRSVVPSIDRIGVRATTAAIARSAAPGVRRTGVSEGTATSVKIVRCARTGATGRTGGTVRTGASGPMRGTVAPRPGMRAVPGTPVTVSVSAVLRAEREGRRRTRTGPVDSGSGGRRGRPGPPTVSVTGMTVVGSLAAGSRGSARGGNPVNAAATGSRGNARTAGRAANGATAKAGTGQRGVRTTTRRHYCAGSARRDRNGPPPR